MTGKRLREDDHSREEWAKSVKRQKEQGASSFLSLALWHTRRGSAHLLLSTFPGDDLHSLREPLHHFQSQLRKAVSARNPMSLKIRAEHPLRGALEETRNLLDELL